MTGSAKERIIWEKMQVFISDTMAKDNADPSNLEAVNARASSLLVNLLRNYQQAEKKNVSMWG